MKVNALVFMDSFRWVCVRAPVVIRGQRPEGDLRELQDVLRRLVPPKGELASPKWGVSTKVDTFPDGGAIGLS